MANGLGISRGWKREVERWMGEVGRRKVGFVFSGTSIQGTPSGPREVSPEQIRGVTWMVVELARAYLIININKKIEYFLLFCLRSCCCHYFEQLDNMHVVVNILHVYPRKFLCLLCFKFISIHYHTPKQRKSKNHDSLTAVHVSLRCCVKFPQV